MEFKELIRALEPLDNGLAFALEANLLSTPREIREEILEDKLRILVLKGIPGAQEALEKLGQIRG